LDEHVVQNVVMRHSPPAELKLKSQADNGTQHQRVLARIANNRNFDPHQNQPIHQARTI
jgi:hypothetical protein